MTVEDRPYWMSEPSARVVERLEKIRRVASDTVRTVRNITYKLYPGIHGKELHNLYNMTIKDTVRARILGYIPWDNIRESRCTYKDSHGYTGLEQFLRAQQIDDLHMYYSRSLRPSHKRNIVVWFEKETVQPEFNMVCSKFDVRWLSGRGQATWSIKNTMAVDEMQDDWIVLYFGDNDAKGHEIMDVIERDVNYRGCHPEFRWCAVTDEQEEFYGLPEESTIDGFDLDDLKGVIEDAISPFIDWGMYDQIKTEEEIERNKLKKYKLVLKRK